MKFKTYRLIDLIILCVLAFLLELATTYVENCFVQRISPYPVLGLLITMVAITRWGIRGAVVIPFNVLGNFIAGKFLIPSMTCRETFDLVWVICTFISNCTALLLIPIYNKRGQKRCLKDFGSIFSLLFILIGINLVVNVISRLIVNLAVADDFGKIGQMIGATFVAMILYSAFAYLALLVGVPILNSQGVICDVKQKLLDQKHEKEAELKYYKEITSSTKDDVTSDQNNEEN